MAEKKRNQQSDKEPAGNQQQDEQQFPGYPHYPKTEDIMDGRSEAERVNVDIERLPSFHNATTSHRLQSPVGEDTPSNAGPTDQDMDSDIGIEMGTEADVTAEERRMLEDDMYYPTQDEDRLRQARLDDTDFDGEPLNEESFGVGQAESGNDLDMDAGPEETQRESMGQGDEENQYWSLGSAANDDMVEGTP